MKLPPVSVREAQIRRYAASVGIDPDIAIRVAREEGLAPDTWQSNLMQPYGREASYGDFQLHVDPTGKRPGLGNEFKARTGLDPADPANWEKMNMFALDQARKKGWGDWMGAAKANITGMMGVGGQPAADPQSAPMPSQIREDRGGPYNSGYGTAMPEGLLSPSQQDYSVSPSQAPATTDWGELAQMGEQLMEKAKADQEPEEFRWLQPQVFQPLRRIQLGKGLLG